MPRRAFAFFDGAFRLLNFDKPAHRASVENARGAVREIRRKLL